MAKLSYKFAIEAMSHENPYWTALSRIHDETQGTHEEKFNAVTDFVAKMTLAHLVPKAHIKPADEIKALSKKIVNKTNEIYPIDVMRALSLVDEGMKVWLGSSNALHNYHTANKFLSPMMGLSHGTESTQGSIETDENDSYEPEFTYYDEVVNSEHYHDKAVDDFTVELDADVESDNPGDEDDDSGDSKGDDKKEQADKKKQELKEKAVKKDKPAKDKKDDGIIGRVKKFLGVSKEDLMEVPKGETVYDVAWYLFTDEKFVEEFN